MASLHPPSSPLSSPLLDIPWPYRTFSRRSGRYANRPQTFPNRFDIWWFRHPYSACSRDISDLFFDLPRFHPIFTLFLRPSHLPDFINFFFDRSRAPLVHFLMFLDISRPPPTFQSPLFSNRLLFDWLSLPRVAVELFECDISTGLPCLCCS
jgi:hypothetical protein